MRVKTFDLTDELLTLLSNSWVNVRLSEAEWGAAEIDPKRPYGNGDIVEDICKLLGLPFDEEDGPSGFDRNQALSLHAKTPIALQIVLSTRSFVPGVYQLKDGYGKDWEFVRGFEQT
jgi:hypothetical protein